MPRAIHTLASALGLRATGVALAFALAGSTLTAIAAPGAAERTRIHAHVEAQLLADPSSDAHLLLRIEGQTLRLAIRDNAALLAALPTGERTRLERAGRHVEGTIEGIENSWLRLSLIGGDWSGAYHDGKDLVLIDPARTVRDELVGPAPREVETLVAYRLRDIELPGLIDEVVSVPGYDLQPAAKGQDFKAFARHLGAGLATALAKNAVRQLRLTVVTDTEFSSVHGNNRDAVVASRVNVVDGIYSSQFQTRIVIGTLRHLSSNGTLITTVVSGQDTLLSRFRTFMNSGAGSSIPKGGLNHLFSGKDFDGSTVGVAYLRVLCSAASGYGINQVRAANTTTALTIAHELGHNFGASHDGQAGSVCAAQTGSWLMSPSLNGSSTFSPCSRDSIEPRIASASCFQPVTVVGEVFRSGFELQ